MVESWKTAAGGSCCKLIRLPLVQSHLLNHHKQKAQARSTWPVAWKSLITPYLSKYRLRVRPWAADADCSRWASCGVRKPDTLTGRNFQSGVCKVGSCKIDPGLGLRREGLGDRTAQSKVPDQSSVILVVKDHSRARQAFGPVPTMVPVQKSKTLSSVWAPCTPVQNGLSPAATSPGTRCPGLPPRRFRQVSLTASAGRKRGLYLLAGLTLSLARGTQALRQQMKGKETFEQARLAGDAKLAGGRLELQGSETCKESRAGLFQRPCSPTEA